MDTPSSFIQQLTVNAEASRSPEHRLRVSHFYRTAATNLFDARTSLLAAGVTIISPMVLPLHPNSGEHHLHAPSTGDPPPCSKQQLQRPEPWHLCNLHRRALSCLVDANPTLPLRRPLRHHCLASILASLPPLPSRTFTPPPLPRHLLSVAAGKSLHRASRPPRRSCNFTPPSRRSAQAPFVRHGKPPPCRPPPSQPPSDVPPPASLQDLELFCRLPSHRSWNPTQQQPAIIIPIDLICHGRATWELQSTPLVAALKLPFAVPSAPSHPFDASPLLPQRSPLMPPPAITASAALHLIPVKLAITTITTLAHVALSPLIANCLPLHLAPLRQTHTHDPMAPTLRLTPRPSHSSTSLLRDLRPRR